MLRFSPILATFAVRTSLTVDPWNGSSKKTSISRSPFTSASAAIASTNSTNSSFFDTKSVSELTSAIAATLLPSPKAILTSPSAAILPDFFCAFMIPFSRSQSTALSMSPSVSTSAFLQSIIPEPVSSRSSLTSAAVTAIVSSLLNNRPSRVSSRSGRHSLVILCVYKNLFNLCFCFSLSFLSWNLASIEALALLCLDYSICHCRSD